MRWDYMQNIKALKNSDLDKLARMKKEEWNINCEWIVGTPGVAPGAGQLTTFKAEGFDTYPGLENFDCLREYLPHAHKYGIKLLAYLNAHWYSYEFADRHPGWEQLLSNGKAFGRLYPLYGGGTTLCINSPYRDWVFRLVKETMKTGVDGIFFDGPVVYAGCCYCQYCRDKFRKKYGKDIPVKENWQDDLWKNFVEFRRDSLAEFLGGARKIVKEINPDGVIFLNGGGWHVGGWRYARDIEKMEKHQDFSGSEQFFHTKTARTAFDTSMVAKYLSSGKNPAVVFTHYCMGVWHYIPLMPAEIKLALTQSAANRANPWIALFDPMGNNKGANEPVAEIFGFIEKNEEYYSKTDTIARVALHISHQTSTYYVSQFEGLYKDTGTGKEEGLSIDQGTGELIVDWQKRKGINELLLQNSYLGYMLSLIKNHKLFDIILDKDLTSGKLKGYETLILPNSACLSGTQKETIKEFVKNGGNIMASFETGFYDEKGNSVQDRQWQSFLGIEKIEGVLSSSGAGNYMAAEKRFAGFEKGQLIENPFHSLQVKARNGVSTPIFQMKPLKTYYMPLEGISDFPALLIGKYGKGQVVYSPTTFEALYGEYKIDSPSKIINHLVDMLSSEKILEVEAPSSVEVEAYYQKAHSRYVIHLINCTGDMQRPINEFIPVFNIRLKLNTDRAVKKVYRLADKKLVAFSAKGGITEFCLPELEFYEVIVAEI